MIPCIDTFIELNKFKDCTFVDTNHKYFDENDKEFTSVTTLIKKYQEPFRKDYWATFKALQACGHTVKSDFSKDVKKDHIKINNDSFLYNELVGDLSLFQTKTPSSIQEDWNYLAEIGTTRGTIIHNYLENKWKRKVFPHGIDLSFIKDKVERYNFDASLVHLRDMSDCFILDHPQLLPVSLEQIVYDKEAMIAGQIDGIFYDLSTGLLHLYDYKTDKKFDRVSPFGQFLRPLDDMDDCAFNKYSLQVSIYRYILEKNTELTFGDSYAVWLNYTNKTYEVIELDDLRYKAKILLDEYIQVRHSNNETI